jgi:hypothetical protein
VSQLIGGHAVTALAAAELIEQHEVGGHLGMLAAKVLQL